LRGWTHRVTIFSTLDQISIDKEESLEKAGITIIRKSIARVLRGDGHSLNGVELVDGSSLQIESLWVRPTQHQAPLINNLALRLREDGAIWLDEFGETSVPGILAAGDCTSGPAQQAILAAADGAKIAFRVIHNLVLSEHAPN
jgi:thioredoxin reductase